MLNKTSIAFKDYQSPVLGYAGSLGIKVEGYFDGMVALANLDSF